MLAVTALAQATTWNVGPGESIQAAIIAAGPGDTVEVATGTYIETDGLIIDKPLTLQGAGTALTTVENPQHLSDTTWPLKITGNDVIVKGFTLVGPGSGIILWILDTTGVVVEDIILWTSTSVGIRLEASTGGTFNNVEVRQITSDQDAAIGLRITGGGGHTFTGLTIDGVTAGNWAKGIELATLGAGTDSNSFTGTTITNVISNGESNDEARGIELGTLGVSGTTFSDTEISDITSNGNIRGISTHYKVSLNSFTDTRILRLLASEGAYGIYDIGNSNTFTNTVIETVESTSASGTACGLFGFEASDLLFDGASISDLHSPNTVIGAYLRGYPDSGCTLRNVNVDLTGAGTPTAGQYGIHVWMCDSTALTIEDNTLNGTGTGLMLEDVSGPELAIGNTIFGDTLAWYIYLTNSTVDVDAMSATFEGALSDADIEGRVWHDVDDVTLGHVYFAYEVEPVPSVTISINANPINILADGKATSTIAATVKDQYGNNVPDGTNVTFTTDHGTLGSSTVTKKTSGGVATATLTSELSTETIIATVTATANGASGATAVFFTPEGGAEVEETESEDVSGSGGTISSGESPTGGEVTVSGSDIPEGTTLTVAKYGSNPGDTPTFEATGDYWDTHLNNDTGVTSVTINFSLAGPGDTIYYWDGTSWYPCSDQTYSDGSIVVTITKSTFPDLSDLSGLVFGEGILDTTPPTGSISINNDATYTNLDSVTLTLSASDNLSGVSQMMITNSSSFEGASWENYATEKSWTLTSGDGKKKVYVKFKNGAGNVSETYSDHIILDRTPPTIAITSPSADTSVKGSVAIKGTASDENFLEYKVEYGQGTEPSSWTEITSSTSQVTDDALATWDTTVLNDGSYTLRLTAEDLAGNSAQTQVSLRVDNHPPQATLINYPTDTVTGNTPKVEVNFTWTGSDPDGITPVEKLLYQYKLQGHLDYQDWSDWSSETTKTYMLSSGSYTFKVRAKDEAGNYLEEDDPATAKSSFTVSLPIIIYPNPCYPNQGQIVTIANLPLTSEVKIYVYDLGGNLIRTLGESEVNIEGGSKLAVWDCRNNNGELVARGIYICFIPSASEKKTGKIAIIK